VAGRFGRGSIDVQYNSKKGGGATIQGRSSFGRSGVTKLIEHRQGADDA
jgi:hypothetical protein